MSNSSQRVRGNFGSGQRLRAFCKKSRTLWPQLPQWTFANFKPKGTRKMLFGLNSTCILEKALYSLAPTQLFAFELKDTAAFGFEPQLTGKKKLAPKLSVRTTGACNPGVPVGASRLNF